MTDKTIDISVIIPIYNPGEYLIDCLESVINQDFTGNYEIILIDDGSTDKSPEICREYAKNHKNITVVTQKNSGQGKARNEGIKIAKGEYIAFVDSDDIIYPSGLSVMFKAVRLYNADIVVSGFKTFCNSGIQEVFTLNSNDCNKTLSPEQFISFMSKVTVLFSCTVCAKLIQRSIIIENGVFFPEYRKYEDMSACPQMYAKAESFTLISETVYGYRKDIDSSTTGNPYRSITEKDINDYFTAAIDVFKTPMEAVTENTAKAFKKTVAGSALVIYAEYQHRALEALALSDGLSKNYILFGASTWAERYLKILRGRTESVLLSDNDNKKHGKEMYGCAVIPPDHIMTAENKGKRILISSMYFMEIYKQLKDMTAVKSISDLMPYEGKTKTEKLYASWIETLEPFWN